LLEPRKNNEKLQKYLEEKSGSASYETASFGETTSADELVYKSPSQGDSSSGSLEIFRQTELSRSYDQAR